MKDVRLKRIQLNIKQLRGYLQQKALHDVDPRTKKCRYCEKEKPPTLETCLVRTKEMKIRVEKSINGGRQLFPVLRTLPKEQRDVILAFLDSALHHVHE